MKRAHQLWLCGVLLILNLIFIWGNSALPASQSGSMSGWLSRLLPFLPAGEMGHTILRKAAHFAEFASLGLLSGWMCLLLRGRIPLSLMGAGLAAACVDETIQLFSPGRASALADVWLDSAGFGTGLLLLLLGYTYIKHKHHTEEKPS